MRTMTMTEGAHSLLGLILGRLPDTPDKFIQDQVDELKEAHACAPSDERPVEDEGENL